MNESGHCCALVKQLCEKGRLTDLFAGDELEILWDFRTALVRDLLTVELEYLEYL